MGSQNETEADVNWWLDSSALPDLIWARIWTGIDGVFVQAADGAMHLFDDLEAAILFVREDEYDTLAQLQADGEVPADVVPPKGDWP